MEKNALKQMLAYRNTVTIFKHSRKIVSGFSMSLHLRVKSKQFKLAGEPVHRPSCSNQGPWHSLNRDPQGLCDTSCLKTSHLTTTRECKTNQTTAHLICCSHLHNRHLLRFLVLCDCLVHQRRKTQQIRTVAFERFGIIVSYWSGMIARFIKFAQHNPVVNGHPKTNTFMVDVTCMTSGSSQPCSTANL